MDLDEIRGMDGVPGKLPKLAWPGGYPMYYFDNYGNEYCSDCANQDDADPVIEGYNVHWEGQPLICDGCGVEIESAYGDPDEDEDEEWQVEEGGSSS